MRDEYQEIEEANRNSSDVFKNIFKRIRKDIEVRDRLFSMSLSENSWIVLNLIWWTPLQLIRNQCLWWMTWQTPILI